LGAKVREFRVILGETGLILRGQSQTYHAKQLAQQAMEATRFPITANEIEGVQLLFLHGSGHLG
jgi:hypothetical protein